MSPREELLEEMLSAWAELVTIVERLDGKFDQDLGDGWNARGLLAHIALWERVANWKLSGAPVPNAADLIEREPWDLDTFNETMRGRWSERATADVVAELRAAHAALVATVRDAPDEDCAPRGRVWLAIHDDGAGHYEHHLPALQDLTIS